MVSQEAPGSASRCTGSVAVTARGAATACHCPQDAAITRPHSARPASPVLISWPLPISATTTDQPSCRPMISSVCAGSLMVRRDGLLRVPRRDFASSQARCASSKTISRSGGARRAGSVALSSRKRCTFCSRSFTRRSASGRLHSPPGDGILREGRAQHGHQRHIAGQEGAAAAGLRREDRVQPAQRLARAGDAGDEDDALAAVRPGRRPPRARWRRAVRVRFGASARALAISATPVASDRAWSPPRRCVGTGR